MRLSSTTTAEFLTRRFEPYAFYGQELQRRKRDDREHFEAVARIYEAALLKPGRKRPTTAVKEHFSVSYSTATKWVGRARDFGFLPTTTPRKPAAKVQKRSTKGKR